MADPDRRTTIFGDQIHDGTVTNKELQTVGEPSDGDSLLWNTSEGKMDWGTPIPSSVSSDINFSYNAEEEKGIEFEEDEYEAGAYFIFQGTANLGTPTNIKAVLCVEDDSSPGSLRIYDTTNAKIIAELTDIDNENPQILDLGTLSNLPTGEALIEVQGKVEHDEEHEELHLKALSIQF